MYKSVQLRVRNEWFWDILSPPYFSKQVNSGLSESQFGMDGPTREALSRFDTCVTFSDSTQSLFKLLVNSRPIQHLIEFVSAVVKAVDVVPDMIQLTFEPVSQRVVVAG